MFGTMEWSHRFNALKNYKDAGGAVRVFLQAEDGVSEEAIIAVKNVDPSAGIKCFECGNKFSKKDPPRHNAQEGLLLLNVSLLSELIT